MVLVSVFCLAINKSQAQENKQFNGSITYSLSYEGDIEPARMAMLPKEYTIKIFGNKVKNEVNQGQMVMTIIKDGDKKEMIILMDISSLGKKIMIKAKEEDMKKKLEKLPHSTIKYQDETKEIAGYKCKKAQITFKDDDGKDITSDFYYSEELGIGADNIDGPFKDVKGTIMQFEEKQDNITTRSIVSKVKKQKVSEKDFLIPAGYEEMTMDQFKDVFGGGQ